MTTYRITVFLDNGTEKVTEEPFDGTQEQMEDDLVDRIEDREEPWKTIGHLTINFRHINGFSVEALA